MADLTGIGGATGDGEREMRGQIILIAAFTLAVVFVALALVVNSAIYTENLASRGSTGGSSDALYLRHELEIVLGSVLRDVNVHNVSSDHEDVLRANVANATYELERQQALGGAYVNATWNATTGYAPGDRIVQNETTPRQFTSESGAADWQLADELIPSESRFDAARAFEMEIQMSSLTSGSTGAFTVVLQEQGTTNTWEMQLYQDSANPDRLIVEVQRSGGPNRQCETRVTDPTAHVDVTGGSVDGEPCYALRRYAAPPYETGEDLRFTTGVGTRYNLSYENGDNAAGNYSLVVNSDVAGATTANLNSGGSRVSPYTTDGTYEFEVDYTYRSNAVTYETVVRIAPGEAT